MCAPRSTRSCLTASSSPRYGGSSRRLAADSVVIAGTLQPNTELYEMLVAALPNTAVHAAGDCTGLGLIRKATEDGARAACAI
jgi:2,4-dienoyl-CoA reductase (NADPH2)